MAVPKGRGEGEVVRGSRNQATIGSPNRELPQSEPSEFNHRLTATDNR